MRAPLIILGLAASTLSALPPILLGTVDTCSPSRISTQYAAWVRSDRPCRNRGADSGNASALTLVGAYPLSNAGCGLGSFSVGGYDNLTFEGCLGPQGPYPTRVLKNGVVELQCAPVKRVVAERFCIQRFCTEQGRRGVLRTVVSCRNGKEEEEEEEDEEDEEDEEEEDDDDKGEDVCQ
jgi:hypothetical protein